ncbi:hypothetical protein EJB05_48425, partial [Eragrostis curvula]
MATTGCGSATATGVGVGEEVRRSVAASQCCYSCPLKLIWDIMAPSCLQKQGHGENLGAGARTRQLTLEEILYPQPSWEIEAVGSTPARRNSPKVCPMNLNFSDDDDDEGHSPAADQSVSISRASMRSQSSLSRRVSFRSPDESDIFIIPARSSDSDDDDDDDDDVSSDGSDQ